MQAPETTTRLVTSLGSPPRVREWSNSTASHGHAQYKTEKTIIVFVQPAHAMIYVQSVVANRRQAMQGTGRAQTSRSMSGRPSVSGLVGGSSQGASTNRYVRKTTNNLEIRITLLHTRYTCIRVFLAEEVAVFELDPWLGQTARSRGKLLSAGVNQPVVA